MYRDSGSPITTRWEYQTVTRSLRFKSVGNQLSLAAVNEANGAMNELGGQGWELVSTALVDEHLLLFMKRQVQ